MEAHLMAAPAVVHATPVIRQQNPVGTGFMPASRWVDTVAIGTAAANYTVPANVSLVRLTPTAASLPCYGNLNGAAADPAATLTGTGSFPIPAGMQLAVRPGDVLSIIGAATGTIQIECWS